MRRSLFIPLLLAFAASACSSPEEGSAPGAGGTGVTAGSPSSSPSRVAPVINQIAFESDRTSDGSYEIFVMDADGKDARQLTDGPGTALDPAWSADGTMIAFSASREGSGSDVYVANADGTGAFKITDDPASDRAPDWSPDGTRLVFTSERGDNRDLWVVGIDGSGLTRLTEDPADDDHASWGPTGDIAFASYRTGDWEIYVAAPDGSDLRRLTDNPAQDMYPAWSPDGRWIAFRSNREIAPTISAPSYWLMRPDGSKVHVIVPQATHGCVAEGSIPTWSPDGERIAFATACGAGGPGYEVYSARLDGSDEIRLTRDQAQDQGPDWSST